MKTNTFLFLSLMVAGNVAFAQSATTTNQVDLHKSSAAVVSHTVAAAPSVIDANAATTTNLVQQRPSANYLVASNTPVRRSARLVDTGAPTTTNYADLHNVKADVATMERAHQARAQKLALKYATK